MSKKRILFISWQGCLGHVTRDVAIAREIHRQLPEVELVWLASPLATRVLEEAGEKLLPESSLSGDYNRVFDKAVDGFGLNLMKYVLYGKNLWNQNVELFKQVIGMPIQLISAIHPWGAKKTANGYISLGLEDTPRWRHL